MTKRLVLTALVCALPAFGVPVAARSQPILQAASDPMEKADPDMAKVLAALAAQGPKPIEMLEPSEARRQPGPAEAVAKLIGDEKLDVKPHAGLQVSDSRFADMGNLHLRFYVPETASEGAKPPVIVYFRGGGWVVGSLDSYDATPAALARKAKAVVISVDYPMAPENKFPAAHEEAVDAYRYVLANAEGWGYDRSRLVLVGESAGGNLAVNTAIAAREGGLQRPNALVAIYPVATSAMDTVSKREDATAKPLNTAMMTWFFGHVVRNDADRKDPRLDLVTANLRDLPPTTIIGAEIDPLRSDGEMLARKLEADGVVSERRVFAGVTHEFFGMDAVVGKAREAQDYAVAQIRKAFDAVK